MFPKPVKTLEDYDLTLKFFEKLLRSDSECHLEDEYPLAFHKNQMDHIFVSRPGGEPLAGLATLEREIEGQKNTSYKALFVGSVVTDPKARHQGLQRQLFHAIDEAAEAWGIDFIVLWSNQTDFYKKLGFELAGLQASWISNGSSTIKKNPKIITRVGSTLEMPISEKHFASFSKKTFRVKRSLDEMKKLWRIPKMLVACTENAYALVGKGEDFQGICHEWAGPAEEVLACFDALKTQLPQLRILSPGILHDGDESAVVDALEAASFECRLEYLGLFKAVSSRVSIKDFAPEDLKLPFFIWGLDSI
ncbi:MAG: putative acetyltransferase [Bacteriovoracaceae bacterium]|nr:putative acetyltransferase [Bacteriovoracaceae bacterium]